MWWKNLFILQDCADKNSFNLTLWWKKWMVVVCVPAFLTALPCHAGGAFLFFYFFWWRWCAPPVVNNMKFYFKIQCQGWWTHTHKVAWMNEQQLVGLCSQIFHVIDQFVSKGIIKYRHAIAIETLAGRFGMYEYSAFREKWFKRHKFHPFREKEVKWRNLTRSL